MDTEKKLKLINGQARRLKNINLDEFLITEDILRLGIIVEPVAPATSIFSDKINMEYLKGVKIIEDLRKCVDYLLESCHSKHEKNICEAVRDLDACRLFLETELHKGNLSFHTYTIGSFSPKFYFCEVVSSYEEAVNRVYMVFDKVNNGDKKIVRLLEDIITSMEKNPLNL